MASSTLSLQSSPPSRHCHSKTVVSPPTVIIPSSSSSSQDDTRARECLLFPTYAYRNPKQPTEWVIRTRGWALSHNRSNTKQKFVTSFCKGVVGQNASDQATFQERFKYFLAKNKRNKHFDIQAIGIHASSDLQRRDSDGSTDSGYQSSGTPTATPSMATYVDPDDADCDDDDDLYEMERPVNPLSSILSGSRSTPSLASSCNGSRYHFHPNNNDDLTSYSPSDTSTLCSSLFTSPSLTTSTSTTTTNTTTTMTTTTTDGRAFFTSESSGFFAGSTYLSHHQVLQWAKEKDCCDARLVRLATTPRPGLAFPPSTGMVNLVEPTGISIISDIDDTIKETRILHGARTVLANTFFNPSKAIPGMAEAYMKWYTQGASFHYVSNSPFQLLPFLQQFLQSSQFPAGSMHLRLDGSLLARLIEVPGRAKRDAIVSILSDFPHRHFVLVGDSGEIDLEIYTKIALEHPGRILKIFIHNVTTPYALHKATINNSNSSSKKKKTAATAAERKNKAGPLPSQGSSSSLSPPQQQKTSTFLDMASSITSSSVLGLGRGRTKTLAELIIDPSSPSNQPPASQQCTQLLDRVQKARDQLAAQNIQVVLFDSADTLRDDTTVQEALWQHWDSL
ncbi:hypothetical protein [Absidia glauca]|uniref:Phosphatidate phosphatase APP1 catalytic domain-containing protein n=1 Tax=Absidia glauca TaxID=4829 RepID=A0A168RAJ2_ABSGL|nr:hypothetical protein [Absidia glauca]